MVVPRQRAVLRPAGAEFQEEAAVVRGGLAQAVAGVLAGEAGEGLFLGFFVGVLGGGAGWWVGREGVYVHSIHTCACV